MAKTPTRPRPSKVSQSQLARQNERNRRSDEDDDDDYEDELVPDSEEEEEAGRPGSSTTERLFYRNDRPLNVHFDESARELPRKLEKIKNILIQHGGNPESKELDADVIIADDTFQRFNQLRHKHSLTLTRVENLEWIENCVKRGALKYTPIPPKPRNTGGRTIGKQQNPFTTADKAHLLFYIAHRCPLNSNRSGRKIYKELAMSPGIRPWSEQHSEQSWREQYVRNKAMYDRKIEQYVKEKPHLCEEALERYVSDQMDEPGTKGRLPSRPIAFLDPHHLWGGPPRNATDITSSEESEVEERAPRASGSRTRRPRLASPSRPNPPETRPPRNVGHPTITNARQPEEVPVIQTHPIHSTAPAQQSRTRAKTPPRPVRPIAGPSPRIPSQFRDPTPHGSERGRSEEIPHDEYEEQAEPIVQDMEPEIHLRSDDLPLDLILPGDSALEASQRSHPTHLEFTNHPDPEDVEAFAPFSQDAFPASQFMDASQDRRGRAVTQAVTVATSAGSAATGAYPPVQIQPKVPFNTKRSTSLKSGPNPPARLLTQDAQGDHRPAVAPRSQRRVTSGQLSGVVNHTPQQSTVFSTPFSQARASVIGSQLPHVDWTKRSPKRMSRTSLLAPGPGPPPPGSLPPKPPVAPSRKRRRDSLGAQRAGDSIATTAVGEVSTFVPEIGASMTREGLLAWMGAEAARTGVSATALLASLAGQLTTDVEHEDAPAEEPPSKRNKSNNSEEPVSTTGPPGTQRTLRKPSRKAKGEATTTKPQVVTGSSKTGPQTRSRSRSQTPGTVARGARGTRKQAGQMTPIPAVDENDEDENAGREDDNGDLGFDQPSTIAVSTRRQQRVLTERRQSSRMPR